MKKQLCWFLSVILLLLTLSVPLFVHAGDLPAIPLNPDPTSASSVPEVSTEYEVPVSLEPSKPKMYLNETSLTLNYKDTARLKANVHVVWSSSDEKVAKVNGNGVVTAVGVGKAEIKAVASDGTTKVCAVRVRYSFVQWCILILLFGWLWY